MNIRTHLALGRVSNLPTIWTNVLAAGALAGAAFPSPGWLPVLMAMSLFYIAGMYYNDACDAEHDKQHQPHRPIAAGLINRGTVEAYACAYAIVGFLLIYTARMSAPLAQQSASMGWLLSVSCLLLLIVLYNQHHKSNPLSPLLMAACRAMVLISVSLTLTAMLPKALLLAVLSGLCWVIGLTYFAKHEKSISASTTLLDKWPLAMLAIPVVVGLLLSLSNALILIPLFILIPVVAFAYARITRGMPAEKGQAIAIMIAAICLVDGLFLTWMWDLSGAMVSLTAFALTLLLQRWVSGT